MTSSTLITTTRRAVLAAALVASIVGCATKPAPVNLADTIASTPSLSTLNSLVNQAGLTETLKTPGPFTVFAPNNDAFKAVPAKTMDDLAQHPEKLKSLLTYHVIPGKTMAADVKNSDVKTLNSAKVALSKAGDFVTIESAAVTQADIAATNGVLHLVDAVLVPPVKK
ncbi:MAG: fasciclin domain-containing protein [Rhodoferax sp.]|nr:fasciclin domain-containing protein [Rhodoferax sp.]MDP3654262.1 fasciclin domain-containing protein [Rhodoferax sp.]